jgi:lipid II:glycine glycyltransferase (peptidoglycan interpeptide bridge formation enzyme)
MIYEDYNSIPEDLKNFLSSFSVYQSHFWAKMNSEYSKRKVWFIEVRNKENKIKIASLVVKYNLPLKKCYLYSPCGPVFDFDNYEKNIDQTLFDSYLNEIGEIVKKEKPVFYRIDPQIDFNSRLDELETRNYLYDFFVKKNKFVQSEEQKQPENTLIIDLDKTEDEILSQMHQKGRYNIKVAQKHNIKITRTKDFNSKELDSFFDLTDQTTRRDGFFGNSKEYYQNLLEKVDCAYLYSAWNGEKIIASAITTFCNGKAIYYYGASSNEDRNLMAPYLLQWQMIKDAKNEFGCKTYDFLGVAPKILQKENKFYVLEGIKKNEFDSEEKAKEFNSKHKYNGITNFKTKFGGRYASYIGAIDKIYSKFWYNIISLTKKLRKTIRKTFKIKI